jgi:hypothetical protein
MSIVLPGLASTCPSSLFFKESKTKKEEKGASYLPSSSIAFSQLNHEAHMTPGR